MSGFKLYPLDINNKFHLKFTYSILKEREKSTIINLNKFTCPEYEKHIAYLKTSPYYCFYLGSYNNIFFGIQYVTKTFFYAAYHKRNRIKRIAKLFNIKDKGIIFSEACFKLLLDKHPELVKLKAEVNINNPISLVSAKKIGFKERSIYLEFIK